MRTHFAAISACSLILLQHLIALSPEKHRLVSLWTNNENAFLFPLSVSSMMCWTTCMKCSGHHFSCDSAMKLSHLSLNQLKSLSCSGLSPDPRVRNLSMRASRLIRPLLLSDFVVASWPRDSRVKVFCRIPHVRESFEVSRIAGRLSWMDGKERKPRTS